MKSPPSTTFLQSLRAFNVYEKFLVEKILETWNPCQIVLILCAFRKHLMNFKAFLTCRLSSAKCNFLSRHANLLKYWYVTFLHIAQFVHYVDVDVQTITHLEESCSRSIWKAKNFYAWEIFEKNEGGGGKHVMAKNREFFILTEISERSESGGTPKFDKQQI